MPSLRLKPFPLAEHPAVIDVLVAFDRGAKAWAENSANWNGGETIEEFADYAVAKMNTVLQNSQLSDMSMVPSPEVISSGVFLSPPRRGL